MKSPAESLCHCGAIRKKWSKLCYPCWYLKYGPKARQTLNDRYKSDPVFRERKKAASKARGERLKASGVMDYERTVRGWLVHVLCGIRGARKNQGIEVNLTVQCLLSIWEKQSGICAITGLRMRTKRKDPYSASIDRIDPNGRYAVGNVQLVCMAANYAKCSFSQEVIKRFFADIRNSRPRKIYGGHPSLFDE